MTCSTAQARRPVRLTDDELAWLSPGRRRRAGDLQRTLHHVPGTQTTAARRSSTEVVVTVDPMTRTAALRIIWQGGSSTELAMALTKTGGHFRATDEDTVDLVRRLAAHYDDTTIAMILSRQHRRTGTGLPFTKSRVQVAAGRPAASPPTNRPTLSAPTTMMPSWSPSPKPNASSASARSPSTGGCATASSPVNS